MNAGAPAANNKADEKSAASKRRELEQWQQNTGLSMMEVKLIASRFKTLSRGGLLTNESFQRVIQVVFPSCSAALSHRIFSAFCMSASHKMDLNDMMKGLHRMLKGTPVERLKLLFDILDSDSDGYITYSEIFQMCKSDSAMAVDAQAQMQLEDEVLLVKCMMDLMDRDRDGMIRWRDFLSCLTNYPMLIGCFQVLAPDVSVGVIADPVMDWRRLKMLWLFGRRRGVWGTSCTSELVAPFVQLNPEDEAAVNQAFSELESDRHGNIQLETLLRGLTRALDGSLEDKISFYFDTYDGRVGADDKMGVTGAEVLRLLSAIDTKQDPDIRFCDELWEGVRQTCKGNISFKNFKEKGLRNEFFKEAIGAVGNVFVDHLKGAGTTATAAPKQAVKF